MVICIICKPSFGYKHYPTLLTYPAETHELVYLWGNSQTFSRGLANMVAYLCQLHDQQPARCILLWSIANGIISDELYRLKVPTVNDVIDNLKF